MAKDLNPIGDKLNILMGARHLTVLKTGLSYHRSWWKRLLSKWYYIPYETWTVAYFTEPGSAHDYIEWAASTGPRPHGQRFRTDSVLAGFDRAWSEPFFTRVRIDPPYDHDWFEKKNKLRLIKEDNI